MTISVSYIIKLFLDPELQLPSSQFKFLKKYLEPTVKSEYYDYHVFVKRIRLLKLLLENFIAEWKVIYTSFLM